MNKNVRIEVKTPVGTTTQAEVGPTVTQGSVESAIISAAGLDKGIRDAFLNSPGEAKYLDIE